MNDNRKPDPMAEDELKLRDDITNLVFEWKSEVDKIPRGKTIRLWVDEEIMELVNAYTTNKINEALQKDRKANTEFWKGKIDRLFDQEIAVYTEALNHRKDKNE